MRRILPCLLAAFLLVMTAACGSGNNTPTNVGLFGSWNVAMYPTGNSSPVYVFALAMSQEGNNNYSGASTTYNGSVPIPNNMCIDSSTLRATATTSTGGSFTMTITDTTSNTIINVQGTLPTQGTTISGTYSNAASTGCTASSGTVTMVAQ